MARCRVCRTPMPAPLPTPIRLDGLNIKFTVQTCPGCSASFYASTDGEWSQGEVPE